MDIATVYYFLKQKILSFVLNEVDKSQDVTLELPEPIFTEVETTEERDSVSYTFILASGDQITLDSSQSVEYEGSVMTVEALVQKVENNE